jgi:hypothetical protein
MAQHIVFTVSGTGVNMRDTTQPQPATVAQQLPSNCYWQPLGNYPASVYPMEASVQDGVNELVRLWTQVYAPGQSSIGTSKILMGYSQGAIVVSHFVRDQLLNPNGACYGMADQLVAVAVWGNPCRMPGWASGNEFAGWPLPADIDGVITGGISGPDCLQLQDIQPAIPNLTHYWGDFVNTMAGQGNNDLYADAPVGPAGSAAVVNTGPPWVNQPEAGLMETQIYNIVQQTDLSDIGAIVQDVLDLVGPGNTHEALGILDAIITGGMFLVRGSNAAHYTYDITPIVDFITLCANETAPW